MQSLNISLPDELMKFVEEKVKSGSYSNANEVVKEAIENLLYEFQVERLKKILKPSLEQAERGECRRYSYEELMADIDKI